MLKYVPMYKCLMCGELMGIDSEPICTSCYDTLEEVSEHTTINYTENRVTLPESDDGESHHYQFCMTHKCACGTMGFALFAGIAKFEDVEEYVNGSGS